jgi:hypothetical protein
LIAALGFIIPTSGGFTAYLVERVAKFYILALRETFFYCYSKSEGALLMEELRLLGIIGDLVSSNSIIPEAVIYFSRLCFSLSRSLNSSLMRRARI